MAKLIELTKDIWTFGCKGDVIQVAEDRLQDLETRARKLGGEAYKEVKDVVTAADRAAKAAEADVVAAVKTAKK